MGILLITIQISDLLFPVPRVVSCCIGFVVATSSIPAAAPFLMVAATEWYLVACVPVTLARSAPAAAPVLMACCDAGVRTSCACTEVSTSFQSEEWAHTMTEKYKCHCVVDAEAKASQASRVEEVERTDYRTRCISSSVTAREN